MSRGEYGTNMFMILPVNGYDTIQYSGGTTGMCLKAGEQLQLQDMNLGPGITHLYVTIVGTVL